MILSFAYVCTYTCSIDYFAMLGSYPLVGDLLDPLVCTVVMYKMLTYVSAIVVMSSLSNRCVTHPSIG